MKHQGFGFSLPQPVSVANEYLYLFLLPVSVGNGYLYLSSEWDNLSSTMLFATSVTSARRARSDATAKAAA